MGALAILEILERSGSVRQSLRVDAWPVRVGRAIDNHLVLDDPHTAPHHCSIDTNEDGVFIAVGDSRNGLSIGTQHLAAGERWQTGAEPVYITAGRTHLRLRLATHPLPPEQALGAARDLAHGLNSLLALLAALGLLLAFDTYLGSDSEGFWRAFGASLLSTSAAVLAWCSLWALLSKLFAHQSHFGWHLRVGLLGVVLLQMAPHLTHTVAFAFSWPWASSFTFVLNMAIAAAAVYGHLQAIEPHRRSLTRTLASGLAAGGIALLLWNHWQNTEQLGSELYMSHLNAPALRVAKPVSLDAFMQSVEATQKRLDSRAVP